MGVRWFNFLHVTTNVHTHLLENHIENNFVPLTYARHVAQMFFQNRFLPRTRCLGGIRDAGPWNGAFRAGPTLSNDGEAVTWLQTLGSDEWKWWGGPSEQSPSGWFMMSQSLVYDWFHVQVEGPTLGWNVVARNRIDIEWYGYWIVDYRKCQPLSCRDSELTHCCILTAGWGGASKGSCGVFTTHVQKHSETSLCMFPALAVKITLYHSKHMVAGNPHIWWADHLQMEKNTCFNSAWSILGGKWSVPGSSAMPSASNRLRRAWERAGFTLEQVSGFGAAARGRFCLKQLCELRPQQSKKKGIHKYHSLRFQVH